MSILDGIFTGFVIALVLATPAVIVEILRHARELPLLMDVKSFWGITLTPHQVLFWSVVTHLATASLFGGLAPALVGQGILSPLYLFGEIMLYALGFYLVMGILVFPLIGFGIFGRKEGDFVWLELLVTDLLYGFLFWTAAKLLFV